jgi:hypothetical protein
MKSHENTPKIDQNLSNIRLSWTAVILNKFVPDLFYDIDVEPRLT